MKTGLRFIWKDRPGKQKSRKPGFTEWGGGRFGKNQMSGQVPERSHAGYNYYGSGVYNSLFCYYLQKGL